MAISEMKKISILAAKHTEDKILSVMQDLQNIEIVNSITDIATHNRRLAAELHPLVSSQETTELEHLHLKLATIQKTLTYMLSLYSKKKKFPTTQQTLAEFASNLDFATVDKQASTILQTQTKVQLIDNQITDLTQEMSALEKWQSLAANPHELKEASFVEATLGDFSLSVKTSLLKELTDISNIVLEQVYENQSRLYLFVVYLKKDSQAVQEILSFYGVHLFDYTYEMSPKESYTRLEQDLEKLNQEKKELLDFIKEDDTIIDLLRMTEELLLAKIERQQVKTDLARYNELILIRGWIESQRIKQFTERIQEVVSINEPILVEVEEVAESEDVPTVLKNNSLIEPFESITEMYSLPKYGELDPTPLLAPFYLVFFGMMVADIGYGLLMLGGTILMKKALSLRRSQRKMINLFQVLSFSVMIWGGIYGSIFGVSLPFHLLSTTADMNSIMMLSLIFGMIQILAGLLINGFQLVKKKEYLKSVSEAFAWQGILIGLILLALANLVFKNPVLSQTGLMLFAISAVSIIFIPVITNKSKGKGLAQGMYSFYGITNYIGDLVSYTRLMALGISGGSIAGAFNMLVGFMPPFARFTVGLVLIVLLHGLNIFLSLLGAYVHGARLQYVEFFGKFFQGGGRKFTPLKPKEKYIDFKVSSKE